MYGGESVCSNDIGNIRDLTRLYLEYTGYEGGRGPPRAGLGAQGAAQNLPVPNLPGANGSNGDAAGSPAPASEKYSLFMSGIPASLSDTRLREVLEVRHYCTVYRIWLP